MFITYSFCDDFCFFAISSKNVCKLYANLGYLHTDTHIMNSVTTAIILDTRRQKKDGTYPVKLRVTFRRKQKMYGTVFSLTQEDFDKAMVDPKPRKENKEIMLKLTTVEKRAIDIIDKLKDFTFQAFESQFLEQTRNWESVFHAYQDYYENLTSQGQIRTANNYQTAARSIQEFNQQRDLQFADVTPDFLKKYEKWMLDRGRSVTTVSIYLRTLRTLFNEAIQRDIVSSDLYPFGKRKYQVPAYRNVKKALTLAEIGKIYKHPVKEGSNQQQAKDYWMFSYICNGINIKDIALLKYSNIDGDKIIFIRSKTQTTSRKDLKPIVAVLNDEAKAIISRWGNQPDLPDSYVFPILYEGLTPAQQIHRVKGKIKLINKYMKEIALACGIEKPVTTYTARHSFSTVLKRSGAPTEFISESLGHNNLKTTENYLDSFEDTVKKEYAERLMDFE